MCTITMTFNVPDTPHIDVEALKQQVSDFVNNLVSAAMPKYEEKPKGKIKPISQLSPEIQELYRMCEPMKGKVPEWDLNGDIARTKAMQEKYGIH